MHPHNIIVEDIDNSEELEGGPLVANIPLNNAFNTAAGSDIFILYNSRILQSH